MPCAPAAAFYGTRLFQLGNTFHLALSLDLTCSSHSRMPVCPPLQSELTTVLIDIKQSIVHGCFVGVIYHVLCGRADRQVRTQLLQGRPWCSAWLPPCMPACTVEAGHHQACTQLGRGAAHCRQLAIPRRQLRR